MPRRTLYYKWMVNGKPIHTYGTYVLNGNWQPKICGRLKACCVGYHICDADQVSEWCGTELWQVEPETKGMHILRNKTVCRTWRAVRRLRWSRHDMCAYVQWCVERATASAEKSRHYLARTHSNWAASDARRCFQAFTATPLDMTAIHYAMIAMRYATEAVVLSHKGAYRAERLAQRRWIEQRMGERL